MKGKGKGMKGVKGGFNMMPSMGKGGFGWQQPMSMPMGRVGPQSGTVQSMISNSGQFFKPGDWNCPQCGDHQFGKNEECRKCGGRKPTVATNNQVFKKGDWLCPNPECADVQFERNQECRKCGTAKPDDVEPAFGGARAAPY